MSDTNQDATVFEQLLTGGHPNSLGRTLEVVTLVEQDKAKLEALSACFDSHDPIVRLRTSNATKRLIRAKPVRFDRLAERLITQVAWIPQDSTAWTVAQILGENLERWNALPGPLQDKSIDWLFGLFERTNDWIVNNAALKTLANIGLSDTTVDARLRPIAERLRDDPRKSVSNTARKALAALDSGKRFK